MRTATIKRITRETDIDLTLNIDGSGQYDIATGLGFLDHMLAPIAAAVLWMGVYPESFLAPMRADIAALEARVARAAPTGDSMLEPGDPMATAANDITGDADHRDGEGAH